VDAGQVEEVAKELDDIKQQMMNLERDEQTARSAASHTLSPEQVSTGAAKAALFEFIRGCITAEDKTIL